MSEKANDMPKGDTRFQPGKSRNPRGRPRKAVGTKTILKMVLKLKSPYRLKGEKPSPLTYYQAFMERMKLGYDLGEPPYFDLAEELGLVLTEEPQEIEFSEQDLLL
jgi:hypothetical protein